MTLPLRGRCIAIVGAESTGKTTLAAELAAALQARTKARVAVVPEVLREWCARAGRTPRVDEQAAIAQEQHRRIDAAAAGHDFVVCDTTALMTAVYSALIFGDHRLDALAVNLHRKVHDTLLTALDLPWVPDGLQRDGPHVRVPVDTALRGLLMAHGLPFSVIGGTGAERVAQALAALGTVDAPVSGAMALGRSARSTGLFTRWQDASAPAENTPLWACACCGVPEFERALMARAGQAPE